MLPGGDASLARMFLFCSHYDPIPFSDSRDVRRIAISTRVPSSRWHGDPFQRKAAL